MFLKGWGGIVGIPTCSGEVGVAEFVQFLFVFDRLGWIVVIYLYVFEKLV